MCMPYQKLGKRCMHLLVCHLLWVSILNDHFVSLLVLTKHRRLGLQTAEIWCNIAQSVKQNTSSYKFLPNRRKVMWQSAKIGQNDYQVVTQSTWRNMWSSRKAGTVLVLG
jgi:hypothetical protein